MPDGDYIAIFSEIRGNFAIDLDYENGKVELDPAKEEYKKGDEVIIEAKADDGYGFTRWQGYVKQLGEEGIKNHKLTLVIGEDVEEVIGLYPNFARQPGELILEVVAEEGRVTMSPEQEEYEHGSIMNLKVEANHGWIFDDWCNNTTAVLLSNFDREDDEIKIKAEEDLELEARFVRDKFEVDVKIEGEGSVRGAESYEYGAKVKLEAKPYAAWKFAEWNGDIEGNENPKEMTILEDMNIEAKFEKKTYELNFSADKGNIQLDPNRKIYEHGEKIDLKVEANHGWVFDDWCNDTTAVLLRNFYRNCEEIRIEIKEDLDLEARFARDEFEINVDIEGKGSVELYPDHDTYKYEGKVELEATPDAAWEFLEWRGDKIGKSKSIEIESIEENMNVKAYFEEKEIDGMVLVEAGTTSEDNGSVTVENNFYIGKYHVTQEEFKELMGFNPSYFNDEHHPNLTGDTANRPVENVTWYDAVKYCNKLSETEGLDKYYNISNIEYDGDNIDDATVTENEGANGYRLPTEDEHEYAARGGEDGEATIYAGSDDLDEVGWYRDNSDEANSEHFGVFPDLDNNGTMAVGEKQANELRLYDMSGNVYDWTNTSDGFIRVKRGGPWSLFSASEVSQSRTASPSITLGRNGFRLTRNS